MITLAETGKRIANALSDYAFQINFSGPLDTDPYQVNKNFLQRAEDAFTQTGLLQAFQTKAEKLGNTPFTKVTWLELLQKPDRARRDAPMHEVDMQLWWEDRGTDFSITNSHIKAIFRRDGTVILAVGNLEYDEQNYYHPRNIVVDKKPRVILSVMGNLELYSQRSILTFTQDEWKENPDQVRYDLLAAIEHPITVTEYPKGTAFADTLVHSMELT